MNPIPGSVSVFTAVSQAVDRVGQVLFRPFDLQRWFIIGFGAWLASLGEGGGGGGSGGNWRGGQGNLREQIEQGLEQVRDNLYWLVPVVLAVLAVVALVVLILLWLSSRGRFVFLHQVATNRAEIVAPWNHYRAHGNSLFFFRVVFSIAGLVVVLPLILGMIWVIIRMVQQGEANAGGIVLSLALALAAVGAGIVLALIDKLTKDFVVPIMRLRTSSIVAAWSEFLGLLTAYPGHFTLYILFHILLSIGIGMVVVVVILATCCLAGCLLAIPYLGTVLFLPVPVFVRAFSAFYLAQFGPNYDVFQSDAATPLPASESGGATSVT